MRDDVQCIDIMNGRGGFHTVTMMQIAEQAIPEFGLGRQKMMPHVAEALRQEIADGKVRTVIFMRADVFYPLELPISDDIAAHAECNPGTLRILDATTGETLWSLQ